MSKFTRKYLLLVVIVLLLIPAYFLFVEAHPKTAERFPFMVFLLAVDIYLWYSLKSKITSLALPVKFTIGILYWLPLVAFLFLTSISSVNNVNLVHPPLVSYIFGTAVIIYFAKLLTVIFFLLADFYRIILFIFRHARAKKTGKPIKDRTNISRGKFLRTIGLATGGLFFSGMVIGMVKWAHDFRVRRIGLNFPNLPWPFEGLRIVQISDLHLGSWASTDPIEEAVQIINDLDADLVLFTGDLVNYSTKEAFRFKDALESIKARHGVYAILGNHDYGDYVNWNSEAEKVENMNSLYSFFEEIGWKLLRNENDIIEIEGEKLALIGVENWSASNRFPKLGKLSKAIEGAEDSPVKILLSHDPTHWEKEVSLKYPDIDLTLSGHTHGFQFGVELKHFRWSFAQYVYKYWAGLYKAENAKKPQYLYVNRGLGMIGYPGRVGILPEITLFTLNS
ncbi:MAG: metallophosphoesterase [Bacteroidales bacterium]|nr:metallophosphoesterase [Bacteroidales bacterium]